MPRYYVAADSEDEAWGELRNRLSRNVSTEPGPAARRAAECRLMGWPTEVYATNGLIKLDRDEDPDGKPCSSCGRKFRGSSTRAEFCGWCEGKAE